MFYNHEVLTSRKYGIATIWLVATLGSKSALKKINRRAILEVNIFKACGTIVEPAVPMALRLQSNLLYGVSRVYDQQCTFVLSEAQAVQNDLKRAVHTIPRLELDAEIRKAARPEQLLLQDDPSFVPDLAFANLELDLDMANLGLTSDDSSQSSNLLSPHTPRSSQSSNGDLPQIIIPSSDSGRAGDIGNYGFGIDDFRFGRMSGITSSGLHRFGEEQEALLNDDLGFAIDGDGNLVQDTVEHLTEKATPVVPKDVSGGRRDSSLLAQVQQEHEEAPGPGSNFNNDVAMEYSLPPVDNDMDPSAAEPFAARTHPIQLADRIPHRLSSSDHVNREGESPQSAEAPSRRSKTIKFLQLDRDNEIKSSEIKSWDDNYTSNMVKAATHRAINRAPMLARKTAEHWVWTMGIGGVGAILAGSNISTPLDIFFGDKLFAIVTGSDTEFNPRKRDHSSVDGGSSESEERRVRAKSHSLVEVGRGNTDVNMDADQLQNIMDDEDIELGRNAPTPLPGDLAGDPSSIMPWNRSASQRSAGLPGSAIPLNQSFRAPSRRVSISSATPLHAGSFRHRPVSASPLSGHGLQLSRQGSLAPAAQSSSLAGGESGLGGHFDLAGGIGVETDALDTQQMFELLGPASNADTQTAGQSQWVKQVMDQESVNFLDFVETSLVALEEQSHPSTSGKDPKKISFDVLLNSTTNSKVVAAQALLHCLTLATKNMLRVHQQDGFGDILLALVHENRHAIHGEGEEQMYHD